MKHSFTSILLVDSRPESASGMEKLLEYDYTVIRVDAKEAPGAYLRYRDRVSLVLLSRFDAREITKEITEAHRVNGLPVVVYDDRYDPEEEVRALNLGAADYLSAPFDKRVLLARIATAVRDWHPLSDSRDLVSGASKLSYFLTTARNFLNENKDREHVLVCAGVCGIREVNERYGLVRGDAFLHHLAESLAVLSDSEVCRADANSFVFIMDKMRAGSTDWKLLAGGFQSYFTESRLAFGVKFSVCSIANDEPDIRAMIDAAVIAVRSIKSKFSTDVIRFDKARVDLVRREYQLARRMEMALEKEEFELYLQPKNDLNTGAVCGAEALVRWNHPEFGLVPPDVYVPMFERNGFISELDNYIWEKACQVLASWKGRKDFDFPISVNVSRLDLENDDLVERIEALVDRYGVPHDRLHLEVTESAYVDDPDRVLYCLRRLREHGFKIEMDDFGSGYSSLSALASMPVDYIKLDMRFVQKHDNEEANNRIVTIITSLAKWLNLPMIVEGIEDTQTSEKMRDMGCQTAQGFLYSRPVPSVVFERYVKDTARDLAAKKSAAPVPVKTRPAPKNTAVTVLIAEETVAARKALVEIISPFCTVVTATNGYEAVDRIADTDVTVMIIDLMMSRMDGFEVIERMKDDGIGVPFVVTSDPEEGAELRSLHLGAAGFIARPYQPEVVMHTLQGVLDSIELKKLKGQALGA